MDDKENGKDEESEKSRRLLKRSQEENQQIEPEVCSSKRSRLSYELLNSRMDLLENRMHTLGDQMDVNTRGLMTQLFPKQSGGTVCKMKQEIEDIARNVEATVASIYDLETGEKNKVVASSAVVTPTLVVPRFEAHSSPESFSAIASRLKARPNECTAPGFEAVASTSNWEGPQFKERQEETFDGDSSMYSTPGEKNRVAASSVDVTPSTIVVPRFEAHSSPKSFSAIASRLNARPKEYAAPGFEAVASTSSWEGPQFKERQEETFDGDSSINTPTDCIPSSEELALAYNKLVSRTYQIVPQLEPRQLKHKTSPPGLKTLARNLFPSTNVGKVSTLEPNQEVSGIKPLQESSSSSILETSPYSYVESSDDPIEGLIEDLIGTVISTSLQSNAEGFFHSTPIKPDELSKTFEVAVAKVGDFSSCSSLEEEDIL